MDTVETKETSRVKNQPQSSIPSTHSFILSDGAKLRGNHMHFYKQHAVITTAHNYHQLPSSRLDVCLLIAAVVCNGGLDSMGCSVVLNNSLKLIFSSFIISSEFKFCLR